MKWKFWKRDSRDKLVRKLVEYGIHLLPVPREDVYVGYVYPVDGDDLLEPFNIKYLLTNSISFSTNKDKIWQFVAAFVADEASVLQLPRYDETSVHPSMKILL